MAPLPGFMQIGKRVPLSAGDSSAPYVRHRDAFYVLSTVSPVTHLAVIVFHAYGARWNEIQSFQGLPHPRDTPDRVWSVRGSSVTTSRGPWVLLFPFP